MLLPQLAESVDFDRLADLITDDHWVAEQKLDGNRILIKSPGRNMPPTLITRNGTIYTKKVPQAIQDFRFPEGEWAIDGELVGNTFYAFDLPQHPALNEGVAGQLWARRAALEALLSAIRHPFKLVPQAASTQDKLRLAEAAYRKNLEGLVIKRADSPYRSGGRTAEWLKLKFVSTADCVVLDVRDDGKESVRLGLWSESLADNPHATLQEVGRSSLIGKEKRGVIAKGDVIEVRYLYTGANGRLYQPTILRKRDDKKVVECTTDQLKHVCKEVLEAL